LRDRVGHREGDADEQGGEDDGETHIGVRVDKLSGSEVLPVHEVVYVVAMLACWMESCCEVPSRLKSGDFVTSGSVGTVILKWYMRC
jgi:hypothetical protein